MRSRQLLVFCLLLPLLSGTQAVAGIVLQEDFEDGNWDGWTVDAGGWAMAAGSGSAYAVKSTGGGEHQLRHSLGLNAYVMEYDLKVAGPSQGDGDVWCPFIDLNNYYTVELHRPGDSRDRIRLRLGGSDTALFLRSEILDDAWHHVRIERSPLGLMSVFIDGVPHMEVQDLQITAPGDLVLRAWDWDVYYDNIVVSDWEGGDTPLPPSDLVLTPVSETSIGLAWQDNSADEDGFRLYRSLPDPVAFQLVAELPADATSWTDTDLTPGTTYHYRIFSIRGGVESSGYAAGSATTLGGDLCSDQDLLAILFDNGDYNSTAAIGVAHVVILNPGSPSGCAGGFEFEIDLSPGITVVDWQILGSGPINVEIPPRFKVGLSQPICPSNPTALEVLQFTYFALSGGQEDLFVGPDPTPTIAGSACYIDGNYLDLMPLTAISGSYDLPVARINGEPLQYCRVPTGEPAVPLAPTGLAATPVSPTEIDLAWQDNSDDEDGFRLYRRVAGEPDFTAVAELPAGAVAHQDAGLQPATTYEYRVRSYIGDQESFGYAEASATTSDLPPSPFTILASESEFRGAIGTWTVVDFDTSAAGLPIAAGDPIDLQYQPFGVDFNPFNGGSPQAYGSYDVSPPNSMGTRSSQNPGGGFELVLEESVLGIGMYLYNLQDPVTAGMTIMSLYADDDSEIGTLQLQDEIGHEQYDHLFLGVLSEQPVKRCEVEIGGGDFLTFDDLQFGPVGGGGRPLLAWSAAEGFDEVDGVAPDRGRPGQQFEFRVLYRHEGGLAPGPGWPKLYLDNDGDGATDGPGDGEFVLAPLDPYPDYNAGVEYSISLTMPAPLSAYAYRFAAEDSGGLAATGDPTAWQAGPEVSEDLIDLAIYADDIQFSTPNPDVGEEFEVTVRCANNSAVAVPDVGVTVYDREGALLHAETIPVVAAWSRAAITFPLSFDAMGFYPLHAHVDEDGLVAEWNELNNEAKRPLLVGDFAVPGAIEVHDLPTITCYPLQRISVGGGARYLGTPLDPPPLVQGGTVTLVPSWGGTAVTHTNDYGRFGYGEFRAPLEPGSYLLDVEVTDYTLTGYAQVSVTVVPPPVPPVGPDLVAFVSAEPSQPCEGELVSFGWSVRNQGNEPSQATTATLSLDGRVLLSERPVPALAVGESLTLPGSAVSPLAVGSHFVTARVDPLNQVAELREDNNTAGAGIRVWPTCAELDPDYVHRPFRNPCAGQTVGLSTKVTNWGCYTSDPAQARLRIDGVDVGTAPLGPVAGRGGEGWVGFSRAFENPGIYQIEIEILFGGPGAECDPENNNVTTTLVVEDCPIPDPEYTIDYSLESCELSATSTDPVGGEQIRFLATVHNVSSVDGTAPLAVRFLLDGVPVGGDVDAGAIPAGGSATVESADWTVDLQPHDLRVAVDPDDLVEEASESNNTATAVLPHELQPIAIPECPSYHQPAPMFSDCHPCPEQEITVRGLCVNVGLFRVAAAEVEFVDRTTGQSLGLLPVENLRELGQCDPKDLHAVTVQHVFDPLGEHVVDFAVDPADLVPEYDETNNVYTGSLTVAECLPGVSPPDLWLLSQHVNPADINPDDGDILTPLVATIFNAGPGDANDVYARVNIDGEALCDSLPFGDIAAGWYQSAACPTPWTVPDSPPHTHVFQVCADPDGLIAEKREDNNCGTRNIVAGAAPDLFVLAEDVNISADAEPQIGSRVGISAPIKNRGGETGVGVVDVEYVDDLGWWRPIAEIPVLVEAAGPDYGKTWIHASWQVADDSTTFRITIRDVSPEEFDLTNNVAEVPWWLEETVAASLRSFGATSTATGIELNWRAAVDGTGFLLERQEVRQFTWDRVTALPVRNAGGVYVDYQHLDREVRPGRTYRYRLVVVDGRGERTVLGLTEIAHEPPRPENLALGGSFPNPFNPMTNFEMSVPRRQDVSVSIYDLRGRLVRRLWDGPAEPGVHVLTWDGRDDGGAVAAAGVYFCRMRTRGFQRTVKAVMIK